MSQEFTFAEVAEHAGKKDLYMVIHDKVYDVTKFVDEHPYVPVFFGYVLRCVTGGGQTVRTAWKFLPFDILG